MDENLSMEVINKNEEEIFEKPKTDRKKRVLTDAQKEALAKGRAKAKAQREKQKEEEKTNIDKVKRRKKTKKEIERQEAVGKRVHRNSNQRRFDDMKFKIAEQFDDEKHLEAFSKYCEAMNYEDFASEDAMKTKLTSIIKQAMQK